LRDLIRRVLRGIDALCVVGAWVGAIACFLLSAMLILEVATTSFFNWSQPWAIEYSTYFQAMVLFAGSGWALRQGAHIRVNLLLALLPRAIGYLLDLLVSVFALGLSSYLTIALVDQALRTISLGSRSYYPSETLLVWPQGALAAAFILLTLAVAARVTRLLLGDPVEDPRAGPVTVE
jgi:TRAP-type C4-dicarboxylate transport system permease small subunit